MSSSEGSYFALFRPNAPQASSPTSQKDVTPPTPRAEPSRFKKVTLEVPESPKWLTSDTPRASTSRLPPPSPGLVSYDTFKGGHSSLPVPDPVNKSSFFANSTQTSPTSTQTPTIVSQVRFLESEEDLQDSHSEVGEHLASSPDRKSSASAASQRSTPESQRKRSIFGKRSRESSAASSDSHSSEGSFLSNLLFKRQVRQKEEEDIFRFSPKAMKRLGIGDGDRPGSAPWPTGSDQPADVVPPRGRFDNVKKPVYSDFITDPVIQEHEYGGRSTDEKDKATSSRLSRYSIFKKNASAANASIKRDRAAALKLAGMDSSELSFLPTEAQRIATPPLTSMHTPHNAGNSSDFFRLPLVEASEPDKYFDIPEHLPTSPLCPKHPKHKSKGTGVCPFHGKN